MSRFLDLTHRPHTPGDPYEADRLLPAYLAEGPFSQWAPRDAIPGRGVFILLGVATWSASDMQLLDTLQEAMAGPGDHPTVAVFNAGTLTTVEAFADYVPGLREVFHTPVVGVWRDGVLSDIAEGSDARDLVARMFGSSSDAVVAELDRARTARTEYAHAPH